MEMIHTAHFNHFITMLHCIMERGNEILTCDEVCLREAEPCWLCLFQQRLTTVAPRGPWSRSLRLRHHRVRTVRTRGLAPASARRLITDCRHRVTVLDLWLWVLDLDAETRLRGWSHLDDRQLTLWYQFFLDGAKTTGHWPLWVRNVPLHYRPYILQMLIDFYRATLC